MPQIANIALSDSAGETTFKPVGLVNNVANYRAVPANSNASGYAAAQEQLSLSALLPSKSSKVRKVRMKLSIPTVGIGTNIVDQTDAVKVLRSVSFDGTFFIPETSTSEERDRIIGKVRSLLATTLLDLLVTELEVIY